MTVLGMLPTLREALQKLVDTETLTAELKTKPENKLQIWDDLKILSFTRTVCAVITCCLIIISLRVQLNILGGYMYLDSLANSPEASPNQSNALGLATSDVQQKYLENVNYVVGKGLVRLREVVENAVKLSLNSISLKTKLSVMDVQDILMCVRHEIEASQGGEGDAASTSFPYTKFILPEESELQTGLAGKEKFVFDRLMTETRDLLECPDLQNVLDSCMDTAFARLIDRIAEYFHTPSSPSNPCVSPSDLTMPLAKIIPAMNGMLQTICGDAPNQYVQELLLKEQVKDFAANVYEAFSHAGQEPIIL